jgi:two-component system uhpT operon response regulator UhpA
MEARVVIVDPSPVIRHGIAHALERTGRFTVVGEARDAGEAQALLARVPADVATVEIMLTGQSGLGLTSTLYDMQPTCRVVGLSVIDEPGIIADMFRSHAWGYVLKSQPIDEIVEALETVIGGQRYMPPSVSREAIEAELVESHLRPLARLTHREREVFELLIRGLSNDEIAKQLQIARRTVETHRQRITSKLSTHSIVQMQRLAARFGV